MFGLSPSHILILGLIGLLFGAKRLPELGAGLGKGIQAFKAALDGKPIQIAKDSSEETDVSKKV